MRRFSQKNQLVTLNDINITPLLDLAFVLLIIFIITTPLLEQSIKLNVPTGGAAGSTVRKDQVRTIEVNPAGGYVIKGKPYTLPEVEQLLRAELQSNPNLAIYVRADGDERLKNVAAIMDLCGRLDIKYFRMATREKK
jgi:biopolymer transport protein ExbD